PRWALRPPGRAFACVALGSLQAMVAAAGGRPSRARGDAAERSWPLTGRRAGWGTATRRWGRVVAARDRALGEPCPARKSPNAGNPRHAGRRCRAISFRRRRRDFFLGNGRPTG